MNFISLGENSLGEPDLTLALAKPSQMKTREHQPGAHREPEQGLQALADAPWVWSGQKCGKFDQFPSPKRPGSVK